MLYASVLHKLAVVDTTLRLTKYALECVAERVKVFNTAKNIGPMLLGIVALYLGIKYAPCL